MQPSPANHRLRLSLLRLVIFILGVAVLTSLVACRDAAGVDRESETTVTGGEPFHGLLQYRRKDAKLALIRPTFVSATEAQLADGVSVVGVSVADTHRAYPLYVLKNHQVVNDTLAEVPVAASW